MKTFHRVIFFSKSPLNGGFLYRDVFQIFPAEFDGMPAFSAQRQFHFPNILEFWTSDDEEVTVPPDYEGLEDLHTLAVRTSRKIDLILGLLTAFSNNLFFVYPAGIANWGFPLVPGMSDDEINSSSSVWCMQLYYFPTLADQLKINNFTVYSGPQIAREDYRKFYTHYPSLDANRDEPIIFSSAIEQLFDNYFSLDAQTRIAIDSAVSHTISAIKLNNSDKTLSLLASFTALEALVDLEYKDQKPEKCDKCGQLMFKVSAKFRGFLLKYIGDSEANKKKFNKYYSLRSKVVHTGQQLLTEKLFADVPKSEADKEYITRLEILQLGKMAIANWLLYGAVE